MIKRRSFIGFAAGSAVAPAWKPAAVDDSPRPGAHGFGSLADHEFTLSELQRAMQRGALSAVSLAESYVQRIEAIDRDGPRLNAIIEINPDALDTARALDEERRRRGSRGPLHGIPIVVKDNIDTRDRMRTSAGSLALAQSHAAHDAFAIERLRAAGCVLLGKSNMSEWANFRSVRSTSGWSGRGGLTRNPYALDRNPSGSSSGSAVAVAANLCAAAIGTETDGSIVSPSSVCGIVGLKPSLGLVSRSGMIPLARSQDVIGPMARCVADAAALLGAMTGADRRDSATLRNAARGFADYTQFLDRAALKGARIGVMREGVEPDRRCQAVLDEAIALMKGEGATIIDSVEVVDRDTLDGPEFEVVIEYEFKTGLNAYLNTLGTGAHVRTLRDLIEFNERNAAREMPYFGQDLLLRAQRRTTVSHADYAQMRARNRRLAGAEGIDAALSRNRLDAIVTLTSGPAWLTDLITGDHDAQSNSQPAAVAGYPHITVPAGHVHGLPIGLSFFASAFSEPVLIALAYAFEQTSRVRQPPRFLPSARIDIAAT